MLQSPSFAFLAKHDPLLLRCAAQAEAYVFSDPNAALFKLRQLAEMLARFTAAQIGLDLGDRPEFFDTLRELDARRVLDRDASDLFHGLRKIGNAAVHDGVSDQREALYQLRMARKLAVWFHTSFGRDPTFKPGPFVPPPNPEKAEKSLTDELDRLRRQLAQGQTEWESAKTSAAQEATLRADAEARAKTAYDELAVALGLAEETEKALADDRARYEQKLAAVQQQAAAQPAADVAKAIAFAHASAKKINLSESETRQLIDSQLREAGWEVDSQSLRHADGSRPQKGRNLAIAEWPTDVGPADYALFVGLRCVGIVEAKHSAKDVAGSIEQAKRYSKGYHPSEDDEPAGGPWGEYKIPFLFATNGRAFLRQLQTKSGVWFLDARQPTNHSRALEAWYTPEGLTDLLKLDVLAAQKQLSDEPPDYLPLREYQKQAIRAVEQALAAGRREMLVAMATGTGKTRTCIGLVYRLVKAKRFKRVLFLVDRTALGQQASDAFMDVKVEGFQAFTDIYDVKSMGDATVDPDTRLHITTIQGLIRRVLFPAGGEAPPPVDQYDCIVVDECHRGYTLDRELSESELTFRDEAEYVSRYRRVLDHFDAVKVGLTATPALHTTEIFGRPVYTYSYRRAVVDKYLVDHDPPMRIVTKLARDGIHWDAQSVVHVYRKKTKTIDKEQLPDDVDLNVEDFNRRVITLEFNRAVCGELARQIDPALPGKTLLFCVDDAHADVVVQALKAALADRYGSVPDDAVAKITGAADKPMQLIRRYKNESSPKFAVTVDLLTTGIDVPEITGIVFLRRVRSRILFEQMLGRATRLKADLFGPGLDKEVFRVFDAVDIYADLEDVSDMKPVVQNPSIKFAQLVQELTTAPDAATREEVKDQLVTKLHRKAAALARPGAEDHFKALTGGKDLKQVVEAVQSLPPEQAAEWFAARPAVVEFLDAVRADRDDNPYVHDGPDEVVDVHDNYGPTTKADDYLHAFEAFVKANLNLIPALLVVTQRPRDLTRQQLKELQLALDAQNFSERSLRTAWARKTNQEIAASIIGYVRQAALGTALVPYEERVAAAMKRILASQAWTPPQRQWLQRIGQQLTKETIVDHDALNRGAFANDGGFERLNKVFDGQLDKLLQDINEELWREPAQAM